MSASRPRTYRYRVVDVFAEGPLEGNPLAVFPEARGLDDATMQKIAAELHLSETVFIVPSSRPDCAARLRIFTPAMEMNFAGHPTIGSSYVIVDEQVVDPQAARFVLEENVGPVPIRIDRTGERLMLWLTTPPMTFGRTYERMACAHALGLAEADLIAEVKPQIVSAGNSHLFIALRDQATVDRAWIERAELRTLAVSETDAIAVFVFTPTPAGAYSRMFAPEHGVVEDPATGSATGPLAAYMMRHHLVPHADGTRFISEQGTHMGRRSLLHVLIHGSQGHDGIEVGGHVVPLVEATMHL